MAVIIWLTVNSRAHNEPEFVVDPAERASRLQWRLYGGCCVSRGNSKGDEDISTHIHIHHRWLPDGFSASAKSITHNVRCEPDEQWQTSPQCTCHRALRLRLVKLDYASSSMRVGVARGRRWARARKEERVRRMADRQFSLLCDLSFRRLETLSCR